MASEIKVDTVSEKTSGSGVTIDGLLIKDGGISGDVSLIGTTPTFTIGDAGAEDAALVFDGNAQDFYIALDDSADDLLIGLGSTVGTTPAISIDENLQVKIVATTASTSATTGSFIAAGGAGIAADLHVGDDLTLISDSAVLGFGADKDTTLTHTDGTGLTLNSTNKLCFNDASQFIQGSSATVLSIGATDEIDLTATAVDLNGTLNVSGVATFQATPVFPDGSIAVADLDIDGATDIGAAIVDADLFIIDDGAGGTNRKTTASRIKTYIGGGITEFDTWRQTSNFQGNTTPIANNWEREDTHLQGNMGTGMSESSGIFTFPSTGYWWVHFNIQFSSGAADNDYLLAQIQYTSDNSSYTGAGFAYASIKNNAAYQTTYVQKLFDITDTSNQKVRFITTSQDDNHYVQTDSNQNGTYAMFIKMGDT